jgi:hypothetical protein
MPGTEQPIGDLAMLVKMAKKVRSNRAAVDYICKHATSHYIFKEMMDAINKISGLNTKMVEKVMRKSTDCGGM